MLKARKLKFKGGFPGSFIILEPGALDGSPQGPFGLRWEPSRTISFEMGGLRGCWHEMGHLGSYPGGSP